MHIGTERATPHSAFSRMYALPLGTPPARQTLLLRPLSIPRRSYNNSTNSGSRRNRRKGIAPRRWIRVGQIATVGPTTDDAIIRDLEIIILHADGIIAVGALRGVGHVGS